MQQSSDNSTINTLKAKIRPQVSDAFVDWQAKFHAEIAAYPGFVSLEIISPVGSLQNEWVIVQRFLDAERAASWRESTKYQNLLKELQTYTVANGIQQAKPDLSTLQSGATEVFVTQVSPDKEVEYRKWIAKIHQVEAKFPGFRGVYVQSPHKGQSQNWITILQFNSLENLDLWLSSSERQEVLKESIPLIASLESHRVVSPYLGWFAPIVKGEGIVPVWKQTMIVLLVLFPLVMLQFKFLRPWTLGLNISLATFIANAVSVILISWPMMPIALYGLGWWLSPQGETRTKATIIGTVVVLALYAIEVAVFWSFL
jgi:uncharacterized protein